jgi:hypothetical protein
MKLVLQGIVWISPPLEKGGEGGFKRKYAVLQGVLEKIWWYL